MLMLFHRTTTEAARKILASGFRDSIGAYLTDAHHTGVWLSDKALDINDGVSGDVVLQIAFSALTEQHLADFEWIEEERSYREWLVPAALINGNATVELIDEDAFAPPRFLVWP